jgi:hypothetical protein
MKLIGRCNKPALLMLLLHPAITFAFDHSNPGTRFLALGGCGATLKDTWSASYNQAGLACLSTASFSAFHEQGYFTKELSNSAVALTFPFKILTTGATVNYFGYSRYHEITAGVAFSRMFGEKFAAGIRFNRHSAFLATTDKQIVKYNLDFGVISFLSENLTVGFHVQNAIPDKQGPLVNSQLKTEGNLGLAYHFEEKLSLMTEINVNISITPKWKSGMEYFILKALALRMGIVVQQENATYSFGFGYQKNHLFMSMAFVSNQVLGFSPSIEVGYKF